MKWNGSRKIHGVAIYSFCGAETVTESNGACDIIAAHWVLRVANEPVGFYVGVCLLLKALPSNVA